jgi:hypothetical protein
VYAQLTVVLSATLALRLKINLGTESPLTYWWGRVTAQRANVSPFAGNVLLHGFFFLFFSFVGTMQWGESTR